MARPGKCQVIRQTVNNGSDSSRAMYTKQKYIDTKHREYSLTINKFHSDDILHELDASCVIMHSIFLYYQSIEEKKTEKTISIIKSNFNIYIFKRNWNKCSTFFSLEIMRWGRLQFLRRVIKQEIPLSSHTHFSQNWQLNPTIKQIPTLRHPR